MKIVWIIGYVGIVACGIWLFYNIYLGFKKAKQALIGNNVDVPVKCEECGHEFVASLEELLTTSYFQKSKSIGVETPAGGATVATSLKKKCKCPVCNRTVWAEILDPVPLQARNSAQTLPILLRYFLIGALPFFVYCIIWNILSGVFS